MPSAFSASYAEARTKFLALAKARGAKLRSAVHPGARGIDGEDLAIDLAVFGDPQAGKTLLLISGTHGQEGYTGSAIQIAFLEKLEIPEGVNIVAIHGLNPWGFSHLSRTDENNVDLNRNFRDFSAAPPVNNVYLDLHAALCPDDWTEQTSNWSVVQAQLVQTHGWARFLSGLTGGQCVEPSGLNFGGHTAAWSNTAIARELPPLLVSARKVAFVEWHTGLGPFGGLCHICMHDPASSAYARVFEWMGDEARAGFEKAFDGAKGATPSYNGLFSIWLPSAAPQAEWAGLAIEAGTYDNVTVANALRMDRWLKFGRGHSTLSRNAIRRTMLDGLYPAAPEWRSAALANGCDAQARALAGLERW
jgi:hypothetical protein